MQYDEDYAEPAAAVNEDLQMRLQAAAVVDDDFDDDAAAGDDDGAADGQSPDDKVLLDAVKAYLQNFHRVVREQNVYEIHSTYEKFNVFSDTYFKSVPWPKAEHVAPEVDNDRVFLLLYREMYYRHIYARLTPALPNLEMRFESWENYSQLFDFLLDAELKTLELELPNQWLWDIVDEFIYQFQAFCQFRAKLKNKKDDQLALLKANPNVWNVNKVLHYLAALAKKANSAAYLEREKESVHAAQTESAAEMRNVYRMLGYFSLVGLCRVHCMLGDYHAALRAVEKFDLSKKGLFTRVTACHITLYYYIGFAYLMQRRYVDTIRTFSSILLFVNRTKQYHSRSMMDMIMKKNDQMFGLLAIAVALSPQRIDENIHSMLRDKYGDKMTKMQRGDLQTYEELFSKACPKFVNPALAEYELGGDGNYHQEPLRLQRKMFLQEIEQQSLLPTIRSYLKLYTTIRIDKLAAFLAADENAARAQHAKEAAAAAQAAAQAAALPDASQAAKDAASAAQVLAEEAAANATSTVSVEEREQTLRQTLLCYKHKSRNLIWSGGAPASGTLASSSDIEFFVDQDMVHIADTKVSRRYGEFFIRHINKFEEIVHDVQSSGERQQHGGFGRRR